LNNLHKPVISNNMFWWVETDNIERYLSCSMLFLLHTRESREF
jgi:hypothetical protein